MNSQQTNQSQSHLFLLDTLTLSFKFFLLDSFYGSGTSSSTTIRDNSAIDTSISTSGKRSTLNKSRDPTSVHPISICCILYICFPSISPSPSCRNYGLLSTSINCGHLYGGVCTPKCVIIFAFDVTGIVRCIYKCWIAHQIFQYQVELFTSLAFTSHLFKFNFNFQTTTTNCHSQSLQIFQDFMFSMPFFNQ